MTAVLFVREDLLKASHYENKWINGYARSGDWIHAHSKKVLVSDDHNDANVAAGIGSHYQKLAHKQAHVEVENFANLPVDHKAAIVLSHATTLQLAASASAAVSGFKASMMAGKVPTPSQYKAMQDASTKVQGDVADACAAVIGDEKYEQLLSQASAKAKGQPAPKAALPPHLAAVAPKLQAAMDAKAAVTDVTPPGYGPGDVAPGVLHTFTGDGLESYVSAGTGKLAGKFGVALKDTDSGEFVPSVTFYPSEAEAIDSAKAAAGVSETYGEGWDKMPDGSFVYDQHPIEDEDAVAFANGAPSIHDTFWKQPALVALQDHIADPDILGMSQQRVADKWLEHNPGKEAELAAAQAEVDPWNVKNLKEGDTKVEDGKTYVLHNGHWCRANVDGIPMGALSLGKAAFESGAGVTAMDDPDFVARYGMDQSSNKTIQAMSDYLKGWNYAYKTSYEGIKAKAAEAAKPAAFVPDPAVKGYYDALNAGKVPTAAETGSLLGVAPSKIALALQDLKEKHGGQQIQTLVSQAKAAWSDHTTHAAAVASFETGPFYQKEAIKKLKAEHGAAWAAMHPAQQHELAQGKYKALQGAASQSAAVSGWKKSMLAGKSPSHGEVAAYLAMSTENPEKGKKVFAEVEAAIGKDKALALLTTSGAKSAKAAASTGTSAAIPGNITMEPVTPASKAISVNVFLGKLPDSLKDFVGEFWSHGTKAAGNMALTDLLEPHEIAAWDAASPDEKHLVTAAISHYGPHKHKLFLDWMSAHNAKAAPAQDVWTTTYTNTNPGHSKFWAVSVDGGMMTTTYGKIGTKGSSTTKAFASVEAAKAAAAKITNQKLKDGYQLNLKTKAAGAAPVAAVVPPTVVVTTKTAGPTIELPDFSDDTTIWGEHYQKTAAKLKELFETGGAAAVKKAITVHKVGTKAGKFSMNLVNAKIVVGPKDGVPRRMKMFALVTALLDPKNKKATFTQAAGPKDGDTKPGANGDTLVFKNGRWHSQKKPGAGVALSQQQIDAMGGQAVVAAPSATPKATPTATAGPVISAASLVKKTATGVPISVIDKWAKTGPQKGSNPGGKFKDPVGKEWYCKFPSDPDAAMNEVLACKLYEMLGVSVPNLKLVEQGGKLGIASRWVDGIKVGTSAQLAKAKGAHEAFAIDAWLANWDVVGLSNDNLMLNPDGSALRVDVGGSLVYRAQGSKKGAAFGDTVPEFETLVDPKTNSNSAAVFGGVKKSDMAWGLGQINKLKPSQITELVQKLGPGSDAEKAALAKKLIARRAFILAKMSMVDQWDKPAPDESKLTVKGKDLPKPLDFANMNGPGKGLSSAPHINAMNTKDSETMIAFAAKGDLTALKNYQYDVVDKGTGAALGKKPITAHPAAKIQQQWTELVELLQSIAYPPTQSLPMVSIGSAGTLGEISDMVGTFAPGERVETVAAEHRMHFFMKLGQIDDIQDLISGIKWSFIKAGSAYVQAAKSNHGKLSAVVRSYIKAVQSSGSINHVFSQGKSTAAGVGVHKMTSAIYAEAADIPEGTVLRRWMSDTSSGKTMSAQLLGATAGMVLQNTDSMCASYNENHSWSGDIEMTIRCGPGCKVTNSFATGNYSGEHEITTLPGQRFVVLSVKKVGSSTKLEVLMLPPSDGFIHETGKLSALGKAIIVFFTRGKL